MKDNLTGRFVAYRASETRQFFWAHSCPGSRRSSPWPAEDPSRPSLSLAH